MTIRERITEYIVKWEAVAADSPRKEEGLLLLDVLQELTDQDIKLKNLITKAGTWQTKYSQCKAEVSILRQRKSYYKRECMRLKGVV